MQDIINNSVTWISIEKFPQNETAKHQQVATNLHFSGFLCSCLTL